MAEGNPQFDKDSLAKRVQGMRELLVVLQQVDKNGDHQLSAVELAEAVIVTRGKERAGHADPWKDIREQLDKIHKMEAAEKEWRKLKDPTQEQANAYGQALEAGEAARTALSHSLQAVPDGIAFKLKDAQGFVQSVEARNKADEAERAAQARQAAADAVERQALAARIGSMLPLGARGNQQIQGLLQQMASGEVSPDMCARQNQILADALERAAMAAEKSIGSIGAGIDAGRESAIVDGAAAATRTSAAAAAKAAAAVGRHGDDQAAAAASDLGNGGRLSAREVALQRKAARGADIEARRATAMEEGQQAFTGAFAQAQTAAPTGAALAQQGIAVLREEAQKLRAQKNCGAPEVDLPAIDPVQLREIAALGKQLAAYKPQDIAKLGVGDIERALAGAKSAEVGAPVR